MSEQSTALATAPVHEPLPIVNAALQQVEAEERIFELAQRQAKIYAQSQLVPKEYQNNIGNVLIAQNMAKRMGADTLMVMQNLYVVHGKPGWSAQFLVACFNSCGRFSAIKYRFEGTPGTDDWGCIAFAQELSTGDIVEGTKVSWKMANLEGWVNKSGSKWKTMPEQMFRYRAATFLIRSTAPEIGMGLLTKEEIEDTTNGNGNGNGNGEPAKLGVSGLKGRLSEPLSPVAEANSVIFDDLNSDADAIDVQAVYDDAGTGLDSTLENLRARAQELFDGLEKNKQKDIMAGREKGINELEGDDLQAFIDTLEGMA